VHAGPGARLAPLVQAIRALPERPDVAAPQYVGASTWRLDVGAGATSGPAERVVREIRALPSRFPLAVGGRAGFLVDQKATLAAYLPAALAIVVATTLVALFLMTGSVLLPLKAVLLNLLTLSAVFGCLVFVFQYGHLESLLGFTSPGAIDSTQPILIAALAFGLSTDYGVFLLTRIKEAFDAGADNETAVAIGLERTGRIVTAAALLFLVAIGAFASSRLVALKEIGIGTALAVAIDATIVRALLVPALMRLLGRWNWWAPGPLRRLYARIGWSES
jgi:RND superfamily putative drug exporter